MSRAGRFSALLCAVLVWGLPAHPAGAEGGEVAILQSWQGDYPTARLDQLPEGQRDAPAGFIHDAASFGAVWQAMHPGEEAPAVDFGANLVLFARNTQFYNRLSIGKVTVSAGVADLLAMETMSALPIEDKAAISLVVVPRRGIEGLRFGDRVIRLPGF